MRPPIGYGLTLGLYYLALGTWFGATVMMGLSAGLTFATVRAQPLTLTAGPGARPDLAERAQDFLAGNVVLAGFGAFTVVQLVCGVVLVLALILQQTVFRRHVARAGANSLRLALILLALALFAGDLLLVRPSMAMLRDEMYHHDTLAVEAIQGLEADFDQLHRWSSRSMGLAAMLMAAACVVSPVAFCSVRSRSEDPV